MMKNPFLTFWISIFLLGFAIALVWSGKGQEGTASTIIGSISGYWLGQATNFRTLDMTH